MENKEQNKTRVLFCQVGRDGKLFGSGEWDNGLQIYLNNFRKKGETTVADVDYKTNESYENKQGKVCFRHQLCGVLSYTADEAKMIINVPSADKETVTCTPRTIVGKANGKQYLLLDFSDADKNPYEDELFGATPTVEKTNEQVLEQIDSIPF